MINLKDGSPITNVGDDEEDVLGDEGIIGIGTDSSAWPQNDNFRGGYRNDNSGVAQNDNPNARIPIIPASRQRESLLPTFYSSLFTFHFF